MITEGVIPIAARDLLRVVGSCVVASAIAGGLIMVWGVESPVPHGGMFVVPLFTHPLLFCGAGDRYGDLRRHAVVVEETGDRT